MRHITMMLLLALAVAVALVPALSAGDDPNKADGQPAITLVGAWKRISARYDGKETKLTKCETVLKQVTSTHFLWARYGEDSKVTHALGGPCTFKGDKYVETPEFALRGVPDEIKGKPQVYNSRVEGNKWYLTGKLRSGQTAEEVWERVEKK